MPEYISTIRNKDVVNAYYDSMKSLLNLNSYAKRSDMFNDVIRKPAPRFYVTFENARRFISMLCRGADLPLKNDNKKEMYKEIYRRFIEKGGKDGEYSMLKDVLSESAPSFYLSYWEISGIIYKTLGK